MESAEPAFPRTEPFLCGVVEGFYGRPWTNQQRRELFNRMGHLGMNVYMYAPKDDLKHRAQWRDKYTPEEADCLQSVITACLAEKVTFVYALSPGIDIEYSSPKEIKALKQKFDQVRSLGCTAFALLFDDIEHHMCEADRKKFGTFAAAQVAVTNDVYEYLSCPLFLFCPTEYCESRAVPTLECSQYLETVGRKLLPKIHIFWTGPRVISRLLTANHCARVSRVLRRPALIWDNLHANDYDQRRVYLGPYAGRHVNAKQFMAGVMTNPNCEFEANFVAVATLAHWANCDEDTEIGDTVVSVEDARLEAGDEQSVASRLTQMAEPVKTYHPLGSLRKAIHFWAKTLQENVNASLPFSSLASFAATQTTSSAPMMEFPNPSQTTVISSIQGPLPAYTPGDIVQSICEPGVDPPLIERRNTQENVAEAAGNTDSNMDTVVDAIVTNRRRLRLPGLRVVHLVSTTSSHPTHHLPSPPSRSEISIADFLVSQAAILIVRSIAQTGHQVEFVAVKTGEAKVIHIEESLLLRQDQGSNNDASEGYWRIAEKLLRDGEIEQICNSTDSKVVCFLHTPASDKRTEPAAHLSFGCGQLAIIDCKQVPLPNSDSLRISDFYDSTTGKWSNTPCTVAAVAVIAAVAHELGHCLGLAHTNNDVMSRHFESVVRRVLCPEVCAQTSTMRSSYSRACDSAGPTENSIFDADSLTFLAACLAEESGTQRCQCRILAGSAGRMTITCNHPVTFAELRQNHQRLCVLTNGLGGTDLLVPQWVVKKYCGSGELAFVCSMGHIHRMLVPNYPGEVFQLCLLLAPPAPVVPTCSASAAAVAVNFETQMSTGQTFNSLTNTFTQTPVNIVEPTLQQEVVAADGVDPPLPASSAPAHSTEAAAASAGSSTPCGNVLSSITPISATLVQATSLPPLTGVSGQTADAALVNKSIEAAVAAGTEPMDDSSTATTAAAPSAPGTSSTLIRPSCLYAARSTDSLTMLVDDAPTESRNEQPTNDASSPAPPSLPQSPAPDPVLPCENEDNSEEMTNSDANERSRVTNIQPFGRSSISPDLLSLLIDLFYLPFEHGARAKLFIGEFAWLKYNAHVLGAALEASADTEDSYRAQTTSEWHRRAQGFHKMCADVDQLYMDVVSLCTSSFLVDFYPYIYEMQQIVAMLDAFVLWLSTGCLKAESTCASSVPNGEPNAATAPVPYPAKPSLLQRADSAESVDSQEVEPWVYRGGLITDLHRLLLDERTAKDLFMIRPPYAPLCRVLRVRPATNDDKLRVFNMCSKIFSQCFVGQAFDEHPDFMCDFFVSSYLCTNLNYSFVIEECCRSSADPHQPTNDIKIVGCALAALSACAFAEACRKSYVPELLNRYEDLQQAAAQQDAVDTECPAVTPQMISACILSGSPARSMAPICLQSLLHLVHTCAWPCVVPDRPDCLTSSLQLFIQDEYRESPAPKMLLACTMAALVANGATGVYVDCLSAHRTQQDLLTRFGFQPHNPESGAAAAAVAGEQQQQQVTTDTTDQTSAAAAEETQSGCLLMRMYRTLS